MSLRVRLNILITLLFTVVFIGAGAFVINNARQTVSVELRTQAEETLKFIDVLLESLNKSGQSELREDVLLNLAELVSANKLQVSLIKQSEAIRPFPPQSRPVIHSDAPEWFVQMVAPEKIEYRRKINITGDSMSYIVIHPDASAEITEVWYETKSVLFFLLLFIVLSNLLVFIMLGRYLAPIGSILTAMESIEQGDYELRLPEYSLPELSSISDRFNHMSNVLFKSREENRRLTLLSLNIQEQERRHLAQELHDELGQSLSAIKAIAVTIDQQAGNKNDQISNSAKAIGNYSEDMYAVARNMMQRLRPSVLDELGLLVALQEMIDEWNQRHGDVFCHFDYEGDITTLGENIDISLYRIIQESLTNIVKHARAESVNIQLSEGDGKLKLRIEDDGAGFSQVTTTRGLGLLGVEERVDALNGSFDLTSVEGKGTDISIVIPLDEVQQQHSRLPKHDD